MKRFRQLCAAIILSLAFALSAFAGDMQFPGIASQQPTMDSSVVPTTTMIVLTVLQAISLP